MSDNPANPEGTGSGETEGQKVTETPVTSEPQSVDELPEWARNKLTKANNEAARYRTEKKEAVDTAKAEVRAEFEAQLNELSEAKATAVAEQEKAQLALIKLRAALSAGIPGESAAEFAELLQGATEEEINSHAEKVKSLFGKTSTKDKPVDPSQGSGNRLPLNGDPLLNAVKSKLGIS